ncbi:hypothetical protein NAC44_15695 [Allorhizobium sp. BGMRC 0089]|uniref:hypothetical protein n=1 Tax=Allorhizobium sonneratiae TaxID=2934936 RepID=UPI002033B762|nr:hypothetical protein [Allorhizobium sonneratiae]MCM2293771.1 hypothetical protein [Allorhizobium sonneratiae]
MKVLASANFSVSNFSSGDSTLTASVKKGDVIKGSRFLVENVTAGSALIVATFWKDGKPINVQKNLEINVQLPNVNTLEITEDADQVVIVFDKITFPMGTVIISVERP